jgi:hypothetical protein
MIANQRTTRTSMWPLARLVGAVLVIAVLVYVMSGSGSSRSVNEKSTNELRELQQQVKLLQEMVVGGRHLGRSPEPKASKERARVEVNVAYMCACDAWCVGVFVIMHVRSSR